VIVGIIEKLNVLAHPRSSADGRRKQGHNITLGEHGSNRL
jgi:hypothetical protein